MGGGDKKLLVCTLTDVEWARPFQFKNMPLMLILHRGSHTAGSQNPPVSWLASLNRSSFSSGGRIRQGPSR